MVSRPLRYAQLVPGADLRAALAGERQRLIDEGWTADVLCAVALDARGATFNLPVDDARCDSISGAKHLECRCCLISTWPGST